MATFITSKPVGQNITIYITTSTGYWKYNHNGTDSSVFFSLNGQQSIPVTNANGEFTIISCDSNGTVSGDITYLGLQDYMGNNQITSFNGTGLTSLTHLNLNNNQLTSLDVSSLTSLTILTLGGNQLTSLDVSSLTGLTTLWLVDIMFGGTNPMTPEANNSILAQLDNNGLSMGQFTTTGGRTSAGTADYNSLIGKMWTIQGADLPLPVTFITSKPVGQNITIYISTSTGYWKYKHNGTDSMVFNSMSGQQSIPVTNANGEFTIIPCDSNGTRSGDITYLGLQDYMGNNQITSFNGTGLSMLNMINLAGNQLTSFDGTGLTSLISLSLGGNQLTSLDVSSLTGLTSLQLVDMMFGGTNPITPEANNSILAQLDENGLSMGYFATTGGRTSAGTADYNSLIGKMWTIQGADLPLPVTFITAKPVGQNITIYITTSTGYWKYKHNGTDSMVFNQMNQQVIPVTNANGEFTIISCDSNGTRSGNITYLGLQDFMGNNQITSFNGTGLSMVNNINLVNNQLTSFNGTGLTSLQYLTLGGNQLTSLDVSSLTSLTGLHLVDMMFGGTNPMTPEANNSILNQLDENGLSMGNFATTGGRTSAGTSDYNSLIGKMWTLSGLDLMETTTTTTTAAPTTTTTTTAAPSGNGKLRIKGVNSGGGTTTTTTTAAPQPLPQYVFLDTMSDMPVSTNQFGWVSVVNNLVGGNVVTTVDMDIQELISSWSNNDVFSLVARDANNNVVHQELLLDKTTSLYSDVPGEMGSYYATGPNVTVTYSTENWGWVYEFTPTSFILSSFPLASGEYKLELTTNSAQTSVDTYVRLIVS